MAKSYYDKLKDPRWQRKRLEIMERSEFTCEICGNENNEPLHIHHGYYEKGLDPWEYESDTLWCLCASCHDFNSDQLKDIYKEIAKVYPPDLDFIMASVLKTKETMYEIVK